MGDDDASWRFGRLTRAGRPARARSSLVMGTVALAACATLADNGGGDVALPNAAAGPFRPLSGGELGEGRVGALALQDRERRFRAPAVLDADGGDPSTPEALLFVAMTRDPSTSPSSADDRALPDAIAAFVAADGRSPRRTFDVVLEAEDTPPWEGGTVGAPAAVWGDGEILLYYEAAGGIGLATGDGVRFARVEGPVVGPDVTPGGGLPREPGIVRRDDGRFHLFYRVDIDSVGSIVEATSDDGRRFSDHRVVLRPRLEDRTLDGPHPVLATSGRGRAVTYLYVGSERATDGRRRIALAARFGHDARDNPFVWAESAVLDAGATAGVRDPYVVRRQGLSFLFVTQPGDDAVAVAVAPADAPLLP
ncbi:MAG: hypothetical protein AAGN82_08855 [Myxococcota bacterium]